MYNPEEELPDFVEKKVPLVPDQWREVFARSVIVCTKHSILALFVLVVLILVSVFAFYASLATGVLLTAFSIIWFFSLAYGLVYGAGHEQLKTWTNYWAGSDQ